MYCSSATSYLCNLQLYIIKEVFLGHRVHNFNIFAHYDSYLPKVSKCLAVRVFPIMLCPLLSASHKSTEGKFLAKKFLNVFSGHRY